MSQQQLGPMQARIKQKRQSAATGMATAIWFSEHDLADYTLRVRQEGQQKQTYAALAGDLISRRQTVEINTIQPSRQHWNKTESLISKAFHFEADIPASIQQLYRRAEDSQELRKPTMFVDPAVDAQEQSEHKAADRLGPMTCATNQPAALMIIDAERRKDEANMAKLAGRRNHNGQDCPNAPTHIGTSKTDRNIFCSTSLAALDTVQAGRS
ncbi:ferritin [Synechococcus sp. UW179A]|uniref:ferritin n=1 Tax=Synechococcus sp. UW179A TaxID=2575510 RepID=UPI0010BEE484|nr:ferritin [Synechococcus sp. UW179A]